MATMPKITKVYTRTGDEGTTALIGGERVAKDDPRIEAYGTVDELNSTLGVALSSGLSDRLSAVVKRIQNELFHLGADLATPAGRRESLAGPRLAENHVEALEHLIDELNRNLGPLDNFILPGGSPGAGALHFARTVCRRAERRLVTLSAREPVSPVSLRYLNRLSDALFVMARFENQARGVADVYWQSRS